MLTREQVSARVLPAAMTGEPEELESAVLAMLAEERAELEQELQRADAAVDAWEVGNQPLTNERDEARRMARDHHTIGGCMTCMANESAMLRVQELESQVAALREALEKAFRFSQSADGKRSVIQSPEWPRDVPLPLSLLADTAAAAQAHDARIRDEARVEAEAMCIAESDKVAGKELSSEMTAADVCTYICERIRALRGKP